MKTLDVNSIIEHCMSSFDGPKINHSSASEDWCLYLPEEYSQAVTDVSHLLTTVLLPI